MQYLLTTRKQPKMRPTKRHSPSAFSLYDQAVERDSSVFNTLLEKNRSHCNRWNHSASINLTNALFQRCCRSYSGKQPLLQASTLSKAAMACSLPTSVSHRKFTGFETVAAAQDYKNERKRELFNAEGTRLKEALKQKSTKAQILLMQPPPSA